MKFAQDAIFSLLAGLLAGRLAGLAGWQDPIILALSLIAVLNHCYCSALVFFALHLCAPHPRCKETPPETPRRFPRTLQKIQISSTMIVE